MTKANEHKGMSKQAETHTQTSHDRLCTQHTYSKLDTHTRLWPAPIAKWNCRGHAKSPGVTHLI